MTSRIQSRGAMVLALLASLLVAVLGQGCSSSSGGTGDASTCTMGQTACGAGCTNTASDPDNCGSCGKACMPGEVCSNGTCALSCSGGTTQCGQSCVETSVDPANCGGCGKACSSGEACVLGKCTAACGSGQKLCATDAGSYCATTSSDNQNCGGCGITCGLGQVCSNGSCVSGCGGADAGDGGNPETYCAGDGGAPYCADTTADNANCGGCGITCGPGTVCSASACQTCQAILVISTVATAPTGVLAGIQATSPLFCTVAYYDANAATPTLGTLAPYQAILVANEEGYPYSDGTGLGNVLATYFDGGGRVVVALFGDAGYPLGGTFASSYMLISPVNVPQSTDSFSSTVSTQDLDPSSPVLLGVSSITGSGWHGSQTTQNGSAAVAKWASGELLAVTGVVTDSNSKMRNRVDLNIHPTDIASGAWMGDGMNLLRNALLYQ